MTNKPITTRQAMGEPDADDKKVSSPSTSRKPSNAQKASGRTTTPKALTTRGK